jgi:ketosteroid isomerase-like protein
VSSANVELVRSIFAAWEHGDFSSVGWADPEIEYVFADGPEPGHWTGLGGMARGFRQWLAGLKDIRFMADEYFELDGGRVLVFVHGSGHGRTSGLNMEQVHARGSANLFHIHQGRVTRLVVYWDRERALADVGLARDAQ